MIDFQQNLYKAEHNFVDEASNVTEESALLADVHPSAMSDLRGDIPTSGEISGIEIRLSHVVVKDNKTPKVWPFPGFAKVYFMNIVVSDISNDTTSLKLNGFEKVQDGDALAVDRTLFFWEKDTTHITPPSQVHIMCSLIKSKEDLKDVGQIMSQINSDNDYKTLTSTLATVVKTASSFNAISDAVFEVAGIVGKYLGNVQDKPLLTWMQSYTNINGDWDKTGESDKAAENDYASMHLGLTVRDADRGDL